MALTRYYFNLLTGQTPTKYPISPVWTQASGQSHLLYTTKRPNEAELNQSALDTNSAVDPDYLQVGSQSYRPDAFEPGSIAGDFKYVTKIRRSNSPNPIDLWLRFAVYSPTSVLRGVLFEGVPSVATAISNSNTPFQVRVFTGVFTEGVVQQPGDILVMEKGARATGAYTYWTQLDIPIRDSLTVPDFPAVNGQEGVEGNPWLEINALAPGFSNLHLGSVEAPLFALGSQPVTQMYLGNDSVLET